MKTRKSASSASIPIIILVLVIIALGCAYFFADYLFPGLAPHVAPSSVPTAMPHTTREATPSATPSQFPLPSAVPTTTPSPSPTPIPTLDPQIAREKLNKARELVESGDMKGALKLIEETISQPLPSFMSASATKLHKDVVNCIAMMDSTEVSPAMLGGKLVSLQLKGAGQFDGVVEKEDEKTITIRTSGGITVTFNRSEIERISPLTVEDFKRANRPTLEKLIEGAKRREDGGWLSWWKAFKYARKFDLHPELWKIYTEMDSRYKDLPEQLADYNAFQLYRRALSFFSRGMNNSAISTAKEIIANYGKSAYAADALELLVKLGAIQQPPKTERPPEPSPRPVPSTSASPIRTPQPSSSPTASPSATPVPQSRVADPPKATNDALKNANEQYLKAKALVQKAFDSMDDDNYKKAIENFDAAIALLVEAQSVYESEYQADPRRGDIAEFIEQVNRLLYLCRKSKPLGVWN